MKTRTLRWLICLLIGTGAAIGFQAFAQGQDDPVVRKIIELGTRDNQVMTWNDYASNRFGGRETGTNAYTDATQWAVWQFKQFGLDAQLDPQIQRAEREAEGRVQTHGTPPRRRRRPTSTASESTSSTRLRTTPESGSLSSAR